MDPNYYLIAGYILIGFLVASAVTRFTEFLATEVEDTATAPLFCIMVAIWPVIAAGFALVLPFKLLYRYIDFLTDRS
jgi:ABC-type Na+ efflux pump permease subunit